MRGTEQEGEQRSEGKERQGEKETALTTTIELLNSAVPKACFL